MYFQDFHQNYATHSRSEEGKERTDRREGRMERREGERKVISFESVEKEVEENL